MCEKNESISKQVRAPYYLVRDTDKGMLDIFESLYKSIDIRCPYCDAVYRTDFLQHALLCVECNRRFAFLIGFEPKLEIYKLEKEDIGTPKFPGEEAANDG